MWPAHRLDVAAPDILSALAYRHDPATPQAPRLESRIGPEAMAFLSVRSAWDCLLSALKLPEGSEVVMSAITIPDMATIVQEHGLVPVFVDVDPWTLDMDESSAFKAFGKRTKVFIHAHLFGGLSVPTLGPNTPSRVLSVEDMAQGFNGRMVRSSWADVSLYSFGTIKTRTCAGGAIALVRPRNLREAMTEHHDGWPVQPRSAWNAKATKTLALLALQDHGVYSAMSRIATAAGIDIGSAAIAATRGNAGVADIRAARRHRPSDALCAFLYRRLSHAAVDARTAARAAWGEAIVQSPAGRSVLGHSATRRTHWLMPVVARHPARLIRALSDEGFCATQGTTSLVALGGENARRAMDNCVFAPCYPEMPSTARDRMVAIIAAHL